MIYSQNCFESLDHHFSWAKLDQCEAFDTLAQLAIEQSGESGTEATYFDKDVLRGRYTKAAVDRNADPAGVQAHLSNLTSVALARISDLEKETSQEAAVGSVGADTADENSNGVGGSAVSPPMGDPNEAVGNDY
jgi:hypothetical protein